MAIEDLLAVVVPPPHPLDAGPSKRWKSIQDQLGIKLPQDLRDFGLHYGTGSFPHLGIYVFNPFASTYFRDLETYHSSWRSLRDQSDEVPYPVFPKRPGLLSWGAEEEGAGLFWLTEGAPKKWPILVRNRDTSKYLRFEMPLTAFLAKVFKREITIDHIWPSQWFVDPKSLVFQPVQSALAREPKTIYQLYAENGNEAGFWVGSENILAPGHVAFVKSIGGKTKGVLSDTGGSIGDIPVIVSIYSGRLLTAENVEWTDFTGYPCFRRVSGPADVQRKGGRKQ